MQDYYKALQRVNAGSPFAREIDGGGQTPNFNMSPSDNQTRQSIMEKFNKYSNQFEEQRQPLQSFSPSPPQDFTGGLTGQARSNVLSGMMDGPTKQNAQILRGNNMNIPQNVQGLIGNASQKYKVRADLIGAVMQVESNFKQDVKSRAGASGLMQLMPATAKALGVDRNNPQQNVDGGAKYLNQMLKKYPDVRLALSAYNWGPGNVDKALKKYGNSFEAIQPHMPKETRNYVPKVLGNLGMGG